MYTANILSKTLARASNQIIVDVEFDDGVSPFTQKFNFPLSTTIDRIKENINAYKTQLESAEVFVDSIPEGQVDFTGVSDGTQTQDDIDRVTWFRNWGRLQAVNQLIDMGVLTGSEPKVIALQDAVNTGFKAEYVDQM